jgi:membrane protease YdiL (CAAX protease family)
MFTQLTDSAKAFVFYGIAVVLTVMVTLVVSRLGELTADFLHMYGPTLATLLMLLVVTRDGRSRQAWRALGVQRAGWRSWPLALLAPLAIMTTVYGIVWSSGVGHAAVPEGWTLGSYAPDFLIDLAFASVLALGEEIGFRSYLLPRLMSLGTTRALLLSGLLHGLWHFPFMLWSGYFPFHGSWLVIGPLFALILTGAGVFYGYLRITSGSVWPSTIAHAAFNSFLGLFGTLTITSSPIALDYLGGETGAVTLAVTALTACWLLYRLRQRRGILALPLPAGV